MAAPLHVLVIDDDADTCSNLSDILGLDGYHVETAGTAAAALARDNWGQLAAIILDRKLPDGSAEELLPRLRQLAPQAAILVVTGYADVQGAVAAIRQGAADYLLKPIDPDELRARLGRIAEHRRAELELERQARILRSVLETITDAVMVVDERGRVVLFNPAVARLIGPAAIGAGPKRWPQRGTACRADGVTPCPPAELALARALRGAEVTDAEELIRRPGKAPGPWVSASASPLRDEQGGVKGAVVVWRDISERKHSEEKLLQSERLAAIGQMMTGLAHESGNALARSQSCLEMLAWEVEDRPEALALIDRIQKAQDHLKQLYEEVRGYAAPLKLEREEWDLSGVWRQAWENLALARRGRDAALREESGGLDLRCAVDPFRLEQVFRNIFENALAACPDPVRVVVRCEGAETDGRPAIRVSVQDNGPGLSAEQRQRIFDPFFTTKTKGTGLGMAIAERIAEAHGGTIAVGPGAGGGAEDPSYSAARKPMTASLRIAVADDEQDMRDYFQKCLARLGHRVVVVAENGRDLVERCRGLRPDLVITDIKMPDMDGIEAATKIYRERPVPVVLVSAYHDAALVERAEADHILGYLVKPIKQADLEPVIGLAMRRFEQFQALRKEATDLRQALEDRKAIERAKGILMKRGQLDEQEAFRRLQRLASEKSRKLVEVAQMILVAEEAVQPRDGKA